MIPRELPYAGRPERFLAYLIDTIFLLIAAAILTTIIGKEAYAIPITFLTSLAYYTHFLASRWQATPGKRMLNIYVARLDRQPLTKRDALERFLAYSLPSLPMYASFIPEGTSSILAVWLSVFWFFPILVTPERIGMHDRICRTRVLTGKVDA